MPLLVPQDMILFTTRPVARPGDGLILNLVENSLVGPELDFRQREPSDIIPSFWNV